MIDKRWKAAKPWVILASMPLALVGIWFVWRQIDLAQARAQVSANQNELEGLGVRVELPDLASEGGNDAADLLIELEALGTDPWSRVSDFEDGTITLADLRKDFASWNTLFDQAQAASLGDVALPKGSWDTPGIPTEDHFLGADAAVQSLVARARFRIADGDASGAFEDLRAAGRIAEIVRRSDTIPSQTNAAGLRMRIWPTAKRLVDAAPDQTESVVDWMLDFEDLSLGDALGPTVAGALATVDKVRQEGVSTIAAFAGVDPLTLGSMSGLANEKSLLQAEALLLEKATLVAQGVDDPGTLQEFVETNVDHRNYVVQSIVESLSLNENTLFFLHQEHLARNGVLALLGVEGRLDRHGHPVVHDGRRPWSVGEDGVDGTGDEERVTGLDW